MHLLLVGEASDDDRDCRPSVLRIPAARRGPGSTAQHGHKGQALVDRSLDVRVRGLGAMKRNDPHGSFASARHRLESAVVSGVKSSGSPTPIRASPRPGRAGSRNLPPVASRAAVERANQNDEAVSPIRSFNSATTASGTSSRVSSSQSAGRSASLARRNQSSGKSTPASARPREKCGS